MPSPGTDTSDQPSRRRSPRIDVNGRLRTRIVTLDLDVEMQDIGFGGFLIASPVDITTGEVHVFEITTSTSDVYTIRARAVHCHAPSANNPLFVSGWRVAVDEITRTAMPHVLMSVDAHLEDLDDPAMRPSQKMSVAWAFTITTLDEVHALGFGLVCPEVRYASVRWAAPAEIVRRYGDGAIWRSIEPELEGLQPASLLPSESLTGLLLLPADLIGCCMLRIEDRPAFSERRGSGLIAALDAHLWEAPRHPRPVR